MLAETEQNIGNETSRDGFSVEIESPELLFKLLTRDHRSHEYYLGSNWDDLRDWKYDLFPSKHMSASLYFGGGSWTEDGIRGGVTAELRSNIDPDIRDRRLKVYRFEARLRYEPKGPAGKGFDLEERLKLIQEELKKSGLNFDIQKVSDKDVLVANRNGHLMTISFSAESHRTWDEGHNEVYYYFSMGSWRNEGKSITEPLPDPNPMLLGTQKSFEDNINGFVGVIEKFIRAVYLIDGKQVPPVQIILGPSVGRDEDKEAKALVDEFTPKFVICDYCGSGYNTRKSPSCPECGGPRGKN